MVLDARAVSMRGLFLHFPKSDTCCGYLNVINNALHVFFFFYPSLLFILLFIMYFYILNSVVYSRCSNNNEHTHTHTQLRWQTACLSNNGFIGGIYLECNKKMRNCAVVGGPLARVQYYVYVAIAVAENLVARLLVRLQSALPLRPVEIHRYTISNDIIKA